MTTPTTTKAQEDWEKDFYEIFPDLGIWEDSVIGFISTQRQQAAEEATRKVEECLRIIKWLLSSDTGISSKSIVSFMTGVPNTSNFGNMPPSDAADRGRCIRLLNLFPDWWLRLDEMKILSVDWSEQIELIKKENDEIRDKIKNGGEEM